MAATIARNPKSALNVPMSFNPPRRTWISLSRPAEHSLKIFDDRGNRNIAYFASRTQNDFHSTFGNFLSNGNSKWDADQIGVLELHPWSLVPVVQNDVKSGRLQPLRNVFRCSLHRLILHIDRSHHNFKRSNRRRQPESVLIIALLHRRSENALNPDPVASHNRHHFFAILVEHSRTHRLRIPVPQLEDVPDLDCCIDSQRLAASRTSLSRRHRPQI